MPSRMPPVPLVTIGFKCWRGTAAPMASAHRHNEIEINFLESGSFSYLHGGRMFTIRTGQVGLFWAAVPHQLVRVEKPVVCHWVTVPLAWFLQWQLPDALTRPTLHGELMVDGASDPKLDVTVHSRWAEDMKRATADISRIVLLEVEARLRRMALHPQSAADDRGTRSGRKKVTAAGNGSGKNLAAGALGKVEQMAQFIAEHYGEPLRVSDIAEVAGLHPNYAMAIFRRTFGVSVMEYLMQHRISHAQRLLVTSDAKILDIAMESGFGSLSRFYAAFTRMCEQSPKEYRKGMKADG